MKISASPKSITLLRWVSDYTGLRDGWNEGQKGKEIGSKVTKEERQKKGREKNGKKEKEL
jgi:hypothetical protein